MWVAELACVHGHRFEGWFGSKDDFDTQQQRGLVACPQCSSSHVQRCLSAPRLNLAGDQASEPKQVSDGAARSAEPQGVVDTATMWRELVAHIRAFTEDVGPRFAQEARRIHAEEAPDRPIRGQASLEEREALRDEGIEVFALPTLTPDAASH